MDAPRNEKDKRITLKKKSKKLERVKWREGDREGNLFVQVLDARPSALQTKRI